MRFLFLFLFSCLAGAQTITLGPTDRSSDLRYFINLYESAMTTRSEKDIVDLNMAVCAYLVSSKATNSSPEYRKLLTAYSHFSNYMKFSNRVKACTDKYDLLDSVLNSALRFDFSSSDVEMSESVLHGGMSALPTNPNDCLPKSDEAMSCENDHTQFQTALNISDITAIAEKAKEAPPELCNEKLVKDIKRQTLANAIDALGRLQSLEKHLTKGPPSDRTSVTLHFDKIDDKAFGSMIASTFKKELKDIGAAPPVTTTDGMSSGYSLRISGSLNDSPREMSEWNKWAQLINAASSVSRDAPDSTVERLKNSVLSLDASLAGVNRATNWTDRSSYYWGVQSYLEKNVSEYAIYKDEYTRILDTDEGKLLYTDAMENEKAFGKPRGDGHRFPFPPHNAWGLTNTPCHFDKLPATAQAIEIDAQKNCIAFKEKIQESIKESRAKITAEVKEIFSSIQDGNVSSSDFNSFIQYSPTAVAQIYAKNPGYINYCSSRLCDTIRQIATSKERKEKAKTIALWTAGGIAAGVAIVATAGGATPLVATLVSGAAGLTATTLEGVSAVQSYNEYKQHQSSYFAGNASSSGVKKAEEAYDEFVSSARNAGIAAGFTLLDGVSLAYLAKNTGKASEAISAFRSAKGNKAEIEALTAKAYSELDPTKVASMTRLMKRTDVVQKLSGIAKDDTGLVMAKLAEELSGKSPQAVNKFLNKIMELPSSEIEKIILRAKKFACVP